MKEYDYCTDGESGTVEADDIDQALVVACREGGVNQRTIADGAFCWVEDTDTGERRSIAPENEF